MFHDKGLSSDYYDGWGYSTSYITVERQGTGTLVGNTDTTTARGYWPNKPGTSGGVSEDWSDSLTIECDIVSTDGNGAFQLLQGDSNAVSRTFSQLGLTSGGHLKVVYDGTQVAYYVNGSSTATYTATKTFDGLFSIRFILSAESSLVYKDFIVYPC